jgi:hypothetical protein
MVTDGLAVGSVRVPAQQRSYDPNAHDCHDHPFRDAHGSARTHMIRQLYLPTSVGARIGIVPDRWTKLKSGADVVLRREQLSMFGHPSMPANLNDTPRGR